MEARFFLPGRVEVGENTSMRAEQASSHEIVKQMKECDSSPRQCMFSVSKCFRVPVKKGPKGYFLDASTICKEFFVGGAETYSKLVGCYVFVTHTSRGFRPWYVGRTKKSFGQECFQSHKIAKFNKAINSVRKGTPMMFFVSPNKGTAPDTIIAEIETYLIQRAYQKNKQLLNTQKIKGPFWCINGVKNSPQGKPSKTARAFKTMMGIR